VDLSVSSYSREKTLELQSIFASRTSDRANHVAEIVARLDERGIGGVSLNNVHVEAFVKRRLEEYRRDGEFVARLPGIIEAEPAAGLFYVWRSRDPAPGCFGGGGEVLSLGGDSVSRGPRALGDQVRGRGGINAGL